MDVDIQVGQRWRQKVAPEFEVTLIEVGLDRLRWQHEPSGKMDRVSPTDLVEFWERVET